MEKMRFSLYRYNPDKDAKPYMQDIEVEVDATDVKLLDALVKLKAVDDTLSFRRSCREGICGSDAMNINGKNGLACVTDLRSLKQPITLRPLPGLPVIRDLIVDMTQFFKQYHSIKPYVVNDTPAPERERLQSPEDRKELDGLYECILCACCSTSCPSFWWNPDKFVGPAGLLAAYRFIADTRDTLTPKEAQCSGGADYAALALEALQDPADAAYAKELMDRVADDCQFTKDLAACAIVYKALGEQDRAEELLQTAEDYCMSGEEQVALAEAKFKVLGDKAAAVGAYEKALKETANLDPLIDLAKNVMSVIADGAFAKKVLEKAEAKISRAVEYSKLAAASADHLLDKEYAAAIFNKAAEKLSSVPDLLSLAWRW